MKYYINLNLNNRIINKAETVSGLRFPSTIYLKTLNIQRVKVYTNFNHKPILELKKNIKGSVGYDEEKGAIHLHYFENPADIRRLRFELYLDKLFWKKRRPKEIIVNRVSCYRIPLEKI